MKKPLKLRVHPALFISETKQRGRGVFTKKDFPPSKVIEKSSVLVLPPEQRKLIEQTDLQHYIFEWEDDNKSCCVAFGYISMYNHSYEANCEYEMDFEKRQMLIRTLRAIKEGEELTVNYNGDGDKDNELWFDVI